jgi:hypothetical protein
MKAFRTVISKGFEKGGGLRPAEIPTRNNGLLVDCRNAKVLPTGLEGYVPDINDILDPSRSFYDYLTSVAVTITRRWPFPQVFLTDAGVFIGAVEGLYKVTDPVVAGTPDIYLMSYSTGATIWPWICIPILGYPAFTSGSKFVYYDSNAESYLVVS